MTGGNSDRDSDREKGIVIEGQGDSGTEPGGSEGTEGHGDKGDTTTGGQTDRGTRRQRDTATHEEPGDSAAPTDTVTEEHADRRTC